MNTYNTTQRILGGTASFIFTGVGPHAIPQNMRCFALTVRTQGTIIAAMLANDENQAVATAFAPTGWIGTVLNQGEYLLSERAITSITLTAATDSIVVWCDRPF